MRPVLYRLFAPRPTRPYAVGSEIENGENSSADNRDDDKLNALAASNCESLSCVNVPKAGSKDNACSRHHWCQPQRFVWRSDYDIESANADNANHQPPSLLSGGHAAVGVRCRVIVGVAVVWCSSVRRSIGLAVLQVSLSHAASNLQVETCSGAVDYRDQRSLLVEIDWCTT